jgi:N-acyl-D-aspartate/D-glutamate deacylase
MRHRLLIRGGTVIDGRVRARPTRADVLVEGDRIAKVARRIRAEGATVLDAKGLTVTPGFIDVHAHSDAAALQDGSAQGRVFQGVTSELNGACGWSLFPLTGMEAPARRRLIRDMGAEGDWTTAAEYFDVLEASGTAINRGFFTGHGTLRAAVVGYEDRRATRDEVERLTTLFAECLEQGAFGLSTGLCYGPGCFAGRRELTALCRVAARFGRPYVTHMRSEGRRLLASVRETLKYGRVTGAPIQISHLKAAGRENWWKFDRMMALVDAAKADGIPVAGDRYPYLASQTGLATLLPAWFAAGGREAAVARLDDAAVCRKLLDHLARTCRWKGLWRTIVIARGQDAAAQFEGCSVRDVAERLDLPPAEAVLEILRRAKGRCSAIYFNMLEAHLEALLRRDDVTVGSDSASRALTGPTAVGLPHPRTFGCFARFLGEYVLRKKLMPLPRAVAKITSRSARRFGLRRRGRVTAGWYADLAVFDPAALCANATYTEPFRLSSGMRHVLVNGVAVLRDGRETGERPGHVLRA